MDFQRLLLQIGQSLRSDDPVQPGPALTRKTTVTTRATADDSKDTSPEDLNLNPPDQWIECISPYRKLLYNISEDITDEDLGNIKFLLNQKLPRRKLDENVTTLELFLAMEHMDLLSEFNLDLLQEMFESVGLSMLNEKINRFKEQEICVRSPVEDINSSTSISIPVDQNPILYGDSNAYGFAQVSVDPPNPSMDFPYGVSSMHDSGVLPQQVNDPNIVTNCSSVREGSDIPKESGSVLSICTKATSDEEIGTYPMTGAKRGFCLIVNNDNFSDKRKRNGTQIDQECLERVFEWLGFVVEVQLDCTREKMLSVMKDLSRRDHSDMDCVVCCILSHGLEGGVFGVDGESVTIKELTTFFNGSNCFSLVNKPKIFFIQACQGKQEQQAVTLQTDGPTPVESDASKFEDSIPCDADFLLGMATVPSFVSYREPTRGTWFIQALCRNLIQMVPSKLDLVSILTKVNNDVSQKSGYSYCVLKKQMPQPAFSLRKRVIFPVPSTRPPSL
ncbi:hypothetical protein WMY93_002595 [Mugilogobius chulae]|uniref:Caspase-8 n=1 Tax=Mugilogobius chulae TaxID=88201 RepID=A0AAW0Q572_9GOBI